MVIGGVVDEGPVGVDTIHLGVYSGPVLIGGVPVGVPGSTGSESQLDKMCPVDRKDRHWNH